MQMEVTHYGTA